MSGNGKIKGSVRLHAGVGLRGEGPIILVEHGFFSPAEKRTGVGYQVHIPALTAGRVRYMPDEIGSRLTSADQARIVPPAPRLKTHKAPNRMFNSREFSERSTWNFA